MLRHWSKYGALVTLVLLGVSCSKIPSHVISPDRMASLMADIHVAEAVVDLNRYQYPNDSTKMIMKQSVLARHEVTQTDLDTSMEWYSHHLTYYMDVYDKTIDILERRLAETGNRIAAENISIAGDSVDVWPYAIMLAINKRSPSRYITFSLQTDDNWERGDTYTWRAKFTNNPEPSVWGIMADYVDGTTEYITAEVSGDGWREISFMADSTKDARRIYGYLEAADRGGTVLWADSIMLIRNRLSLDKYRKRFQQLKFAPKNLVENENSD